MSSVMDGHQQGLFDQFLTTATTGNDDGDDDDWLNANYSDDNPDGNNNTDNDNFSELEDYVVHSDDDEGLLEATRLHQVGYYDSDGMPYGRVYTKESVQTGNADWLDTNAEDADDEGDAQNTILSAMDAFHLFTMRKRVQEANERWNSAEHSCLNGVERETKVQFAQLIQLYTIQNGTDDESDGVEPVQKGPVVAMSFQALRDASANPDCHVERDEAMTFNDQADLTWLDPAELIQKDPPVLTESGTRETETKSTDEPEAPEPTFSATEIPTQPPSLKASLPLTEPEKTEIHHQQRSSVVTFSPIVTSKPKTSPRKLTPKKPKVAENLKSPGPQHQRPSKTGLVMPKTHLPPPSKRPAIKSEPNIALKSDARPKASTRTVSLSIFPNFPHQQQQQSQNSNHNNASSKNNNDQMNPIMQSVLAPKTLSALTKSWTHNPPNVHMLRELKSQIIKHNIPRAQLQPLLSKRMLSIIFDTPAEKVLSDFMRDTASSRARHVPSKPTLPPPARLSKSEEQQNHSKKLGVFKRSSSTGQQRSSSSVSFKSESCCSKWASKPELIPPTKAIIKNKGIPTTAPTTNTSSSSMILGCSKGAIGNRKKRVKKKAVLVTQSKLEMSFQSLSLSKDILRETTAGSASSVAVVAMEKKRQAFRRKSSSSPPPNNPVGIKVKERKRQQVKGRLLQPSWD